MIFRYIKNCRNPEYRERASRHLTIEELVKAENYWISLSQRDHFSLEIESLKNKSLAPESSPLFVLHPFVDSDGLVRIGGRVRDAGISYASRHPIVLHGKHPITKLIILSEHLRLLHAGPTLVMASLCRRYHIIGCHKAVRSMTRKCVTCCRTTVRSFPYQVWICPQADYYQSVCLCIRMSFGQGRSFGICLRSDHRRLHRYSPTLHCSSRQPSLIWSDHRTNFVGAARELKGLVEFVKSQKTQGFISQFCSTEGISWKFIPERAPNFGALWESAVKSMKTHLRRVISDVRLTFEEFTTILAQVEAVLNSRPLVSVPCDDDGTEPLTPGHFLIGKPLESLPDSPVSYRPVSLLRRGHLCQSLVRHFWKR